MNSAYLVQNLSILKLILKSHKKQIFGIAMKIQKQASTHFG